MQIFEYDMFKDIDETTLTEISEVIKPAKPGDKLILNIASYGGEIFMALGIIDLISNKSLITECNVLGLAASAAAVIALSCDRVNMAATSSMMLHSAWQDSGEADAGVDRCNELQLEIIHKRNNAIDGKELFSKDNWYSAEDCYNLGLCDNIYFNNIDFISARYCASLKRRIYNMEEIKTNELIEQVTEEQKDGEEVKAEDSSENVTMVDLIEKLAERVEELENRLNALSQPVAEVEDEPVAECADNSEQERMNAIMKNICKPQACAAIGATPCNKPKVYKVNNSLLRSMGD